MLVSCLCPTYHRQSLLESSIAQFRLQTMYMNAVEMIICDDGGDYAPGQPIFHNVRMSVYAQRFPNLPAKFNWMLAMSRCEYVAVWEDDDVYMPDHLRLCIEGMRATNAKWAKPSVILSDYGGTVHEEPAAGRFHASLVMRRDFLQELGGWPVTLRADFDQQLIAKLSAAAPPFDPIESGEPQYIFRWSSTGAYHGQGAMKCPSDEGWYQRLEKPAGRLRTILKPGLDEAAAKYIDSRLKLGPDWWKA